MMILITILIVFPIGFGVGFFMNLKRQTRIQEQYYSVIKSVLHNYIKSADRVSDTKYILPKSKIEILTAKITLALKNIK